MVDMVYAARTVNIQDHTTCSGPVFGTTMHDFQVFELEILKLITSSASNQLPGSQVNMRKVPRRCMAKQHASPLRSRPSCEGPNSQKIIHNSTAKHLKQ